MTAPPRTDPVSATSAGTGSRRRRAFVTVAVGLVVAALVRGLLLESYVVPSADLVPTYEPGDRVLVLKTDHDPGPGSTALVEDGDGAHRLVGGPVSGADVVGRVLVRYWPLDRLGAVAPPAGSRS